MTEFQIEVGREGAGRPEGRREGKEQGSVGARERRRTGGMEGRSEAVRASLYPNIPPNQISTPYEHPSSARYLIQQLLQCHSVCVDSKVQLSLATHQAARLGS
jgi:hypothetical protein